MATITTVSHGNYLQSPRIQYISVSAFHNDIYQYTTSVNPTTFATTGSLTSLATVGTATATNCPANRILRANGKKLYPPGLVTANSTAESVGPYPGVTTYMVGVFDPVTGLSGYIDPNSQAFAVYNTDKPEYIPRGINPNGSTVDQGPPVYSLGLGQFGTNLNVGTFISTGGSITTGGAVNATTAIGFAQGAGYTGPSSVTQLTSKSQAVTVNYPVLNLTMHNANLATLTPVTFTLNNTSMTVDDTLITQHQSGGTLGAYNVNGTVTASGVASITVTNITSGTLGEAIVLRIYTLSS